MLFLNSKMLHELICDCLCKNSPCSKSLHTFVCRFTKILIIIFNCLIMNNNGMNGCQLQFHSKFCIVIGNHYKLAIRLPSPMHQFPESKDTSGQARIKVTVGTATCVGPLSKLAIQLSAFLYQ